MGQFAGGTAVTNAPTDSNVRVDIIRPKDPYYFTLTAENSTAGTLPAFN